MTAEAVLERLRDDGPRGLPGLAADLLIDERVLVQLLADLGERVIVREQVHGCALVGLPSHVARR